MKGNTMPEEVSAAAEFIAKVHETLAETDVLIDTMKTTVEVLEHTPGVPEESLIFSVQLINNMTTLKVLVKELLEHSAEVNDALETVVQKLEASIKKK